jgi:signal transduction histidine kinase
MTRVIVNLLTNAIKYSQRSSSISISSNLDAETESVTIIVRDTGAGINVTALNSIFEEYNQGYTTNQEHSVPSTGIGLTFCKMVVEAHKGKIWAESQGEDKGSIFYVSLPIQYTVDSDIA